MLALTKGFKRTFTNQLLDSQCFKINSKALLSVLAYLPLFLSTDIYAKCDPFSPGPNQNATCDINPPNPDPNGIFGQLNSTNTTVNIDPGAQVITATNVQPSIRLNGTNHTINNKGTVIANTPAYGALWIQDGSDNGKITNFPGAIAQGSDDVITIITVGPGPLNTAINQGSILNVGSSFNGILINKGKAIESNSGLITLLGPTSVGMTLFGNDAGSTVDNLATGVISGNGINLVGMVVGASNSFGTNDGNIIFTSDTGRGFLVVNSNNLTINNNLIQITGNNGQGVLSAGTNHKSINNGKIILNGTGNAGFLIQGKNQIVNNINNISLTGATSFGVVVNDPSSDNLILTNSGQIVTDDATSGGVKIDTPLGTTHQITNTSTGVINAQAGTGILETANGQTVKIDNAGAISGATNSMLLGSGNDLLILRDNGKLNGLADGGDGVDDFNFINWKGTWGPSVGSVNFVNWENVSLQNASDINMEANLAHTDILTIDIQAGSRLTAGAGQHDFQNAAVFNSGTLSLIGPAIGNRLLIDSLAVLGGKGLGGSISLKTQLNAGTAPTDRLLVAAGVAPSLQIPVTVQPDPSSVGGNTGIGANKGYSIIQVVGGSNVNNFFLPNGYVVGGMTKYALYYYPDFPIVFADNDPNAPLAILGAGLSDPAEQDPFFAAAGLIGTPFGDYRLHSVGPISQASIFLGLIPNLLNLYYEIPYTRQTPPATGPMQGGGQMGAGKMGDGANYPSCHDGAYLTVGGAHGRFKNNDPFLGFKHDFGYIQGGYRFKVLRDESHKFSSGLGLTFGHDHARSTLADAKSHMTIWDVSVPLSYDNLGNWFIDVVPHIGHNRFRMRTDLMGDMGSTHGWGAGIASKIGKSIMLSESLQFVPLAQLHYNYAKFNRFQDIDLVTYDHIHGRSIRGGIGAQLAFSTFNWLSSSKVTPFIEANLMHEFIRRNNVHIAGFDINDTPDWGTAVDVALGINMLRWKQVDAYAKIKNTFRLEHRGYEGLSGMIGVKVNFN